MEERRKVRQLRHRRQPPQRHTAVDLIVGVPKVEPHDHVLGLRAQEGSHAVHEDVQAARNAYGHLVRSQVVGEHARGFGVHGAGDGTEPHLAHRHRPRIGVAARLARLRLDQGDKAGGAVEQVEPGG